MGHGNPTSHKLEHLYDDDLWIVANFIYILWKAHGVAEFKDIWSDYIDEYMSRPDERYTGQ